MCAKCQPFEGKWQRLPSGKFDRCDCADNRALKAIEERRDKGIAFEPVITSAEATIFTEMLAGLMDYFPGESGARTAIGDQIRKMANDAAQADWLVGRMATLYRRWPGAREMRAVFCSKYLPRDAVDTLGSEIYPDGIPSEKETAAGGALAPPSLKMLHGGKEPPEGAVSAAKSIDDTIKALAVAKDIRNARKAVDVPDIPVLPPGQRISQADIDAAVNKNRERIAREELGL